MDNNLFENVLASEHPEIILESAKPFMELMMYYRCAMKEIQTKLEILDAELSMHSRHNPFESIKCRIKGPMSIINKMKRKNLEFSLKNIEENIFDVAGVRVICSFKSDIYKLAENLMNQDDVTVCEIKDYIKNPKPNGYRSLHLIVEIPIFLSRDKKFVKVEVQFRTIAMDFWASLEHKIKYKKDIPDAEEIVSQLKACADEICEMDDKMQDIRDRIDDIIENTK